MVCNTTHHHVELGAPAISEMFAGPNNVGIETGDDGGVLDAVCERY
jgi:hypothetical protein